MKFKKFQCNDCGKLMLVENKNKNQPFVSDKIESMYICPVCIEPMEYIDDLMGLETN